MKENMIIFCIGFICLMVSFYTIKKNKAKLKNVATDDMLFPIYLRLFLDSILFGILGIASICSVILKAI